MQNHFNLKRAILLSSKHLKESGKSYLLMLIAGLGIIFLAYGILLISSLHSMFPSGDRKMLFVSGLLLGGTIFAASFYGFFKSEAKSIQFLLLPATTGEKLLNSFVLTQFIYLLIYLIGFISIDFLMCSIYNEFVSIPEWIMAKEKHYYKADSILNSEIKNIFSDLIIWYFIGTSIAHFGSISFIQNAYVKTAIIFVIVFIGILFANNELLKLIIPEEVMAHGKYFPDSFRLGPAKQPTGVVSLPEHWFNFIAWFLPIFIYLSFWTMSYFKLKEKQI
ncbi:MAG: hypothetical protein CUR34_13835 [Sediminibacterium sp.]|jgi:hypothetical protein|nr:MAG: hypothetical protein CUR34_13835 [Sediminibacterium sp.] [Sediminibacterium sp. FEMGT703S]